MGDEIPSGSKSVKKWYQPLSSCQSFVINTFLITSNTHGANYCEEEGVFKLLEFIIPIDMTISFQNRIFQSEYEFGGIEIKCRIYKYGTEEVVGFGTVKYL